MRFQRLINNYHRDAEREGLLAILALLTLRFRAFKSHRSTARWYRASANKLHAADP